MGNAVQIKQILERVVSSTPSSSHSIHTHTHTHQIADMQQEQVQQTMEDDKLMSWFIHILIHLWSQSFLDDVEAF